MENACAHPYVYGDILSIGTNSLHLNGMCSHTLGPGNPEEVHDVSKPELGLSGEKELGWAV